MSAVRGQTAHRVTTRWTWTHASQQTTTRLHGFGRLTSTFSKKLEPHLAAVSLYVSFYNFVRVHEALRRTPFVGADCGLTVGLFIATAEGYDGGVISNAERREMSSDRVSNVGRRQMCVVSFCHTCVSVAELSGDDTQSDTLHRQMAGMSVPQHMKIHGR